MPVATGGDAPAHATNQEANRREYFFKTSDGYQFLKDNNII